MQRKHIMIIVGYLLIFHFCLPLTMVALCFAGIGGAIAYDTYKYDTEYYQPGEYFDSLGYFEAPTYFADPYDILSELQKSSDSPKNFEWTGSYTYGQYTTSTTITYKDKNYRDDSIAEIEVKYTLSKETDFNRGWYISSVKTSYKCHEGHGSTHWNDGPCT